MPSARPSSTDVSQSNGKKRRRPSPTPDASETGTHVETSQHGDVEDKQADTDAHPKKKKSKKRAKPSAPNNEPQISTADFLSAIVAAATATSDPAYHEESSSGPSSSTSQPLELAPQNGASDITSEAVLRALQDIDISKIAEVLKVLGDSSHSAINPLDPLASLSGVLPTMNAAIISQLMQQDPPPVGQVPVSAGKILNTKPTETATGPTYNHDVIENYNTTEDAHMLATKWLPSNKLAELARTRGLVYKKGKFSAIEERQLNDAIEHYVQAKALTPDQLNEVIFAKDDKPKDNAFWSEITRAVPQRPIISVYHHVRRTHHPLKQQGKWLPAEDEKLKQAVASLGQRWEQISFLVGRRAPDCRDRWRNHIVGRNLRVDGVWSTEEEEELTRIVQEMTVKQGGTLDDEVFWGAVSDRMGNKRNRQQCRIKWQDSLSKRVKMNGKKARWSNLDAYILVHKLDSLRVRDDTEIDWKTLADDDWNLWSAHSLQRRWITMKKSVKGHEEMSMQEIMEILKAKKTNIEPTSTTGGSKPKRKKYTSAETVDSSGDDDDEDEED
ncbi:hypothetical protein BDP27DRAFT_1312657 [Rhodocollybia butyracea]|uniref:Uncharacterized protein n=1 Tax=Rhodocollybia butyracea TaxID=206335 RepID=A0A9P5Q9N1_9AGAR|nr:hypothetical protein BDP27DRAFT_1312657 [Rhodocollybia butyracea]